MEVKSRSHNRGSGAVADHHDRITTAVTLIDEFQRTREWLCVGHSRPVYVTLQLGPFDFTTRYPEGIAHSLFGSGRIGIDEVPF